MAQCNPKCKSAPSLAEGPRLKVSQVDGKFKKGEVHPQCMECILQEIESDLGKAERPSANVSPGDVVKILADGTKENVEAFKNENRDLIEQAKELAKPGEHWYDGKWVFTK